MASQWNGPRVCYLRQTSGQKDRPKEEPRSGADVMRVLTLRTEIRFAVLKATLIAIRGTRGSLYQKKDDDTTDVDYNLVALDCDRDEE